jgi:hypothetical protein
MLGFHPLAKLPNSFRQLVLAKAGLCEVCLKLGLGQVGLERRVDLYFEVLNSVLELTQRFMANRVASSGAAVKKLALFSNNTDDFVFSHG